MNTACRIVSTILLVLAVTPSFGCGDRNTGIDGGLLPDASVDAAFADAAVDSGNVPDAGLDSGLDGGISPDAGPVDAGWDGGYDGGVILDCSGKPDFTPCVLPGARYSYNICSSGACVMPGCGDPTCNVPGPAFKTVPTNGKRYRVDRTSTGEPVVADTVTGLYWQGCEGGKTGDDCGGGQLSTKNWDGALAYCDSLEWGGYSDWRLPGAHEAVSLIDYKNYGPAVDWDAFPSTPWNAIWTSTTIADHATGAWQVRTQDGMFAVGEKNGIIAARCVRGNPIPEGRFAKTIAVDEQPIVTDRATGLVWQGCEAGTSGNLCETGDPKGYIFSKAVDYCDSLSWGGRTHWRLPYMQELHGIIDYRLKYPALDQAYFPIPVTQTLLWSADGYAPAIGGGWILEFGIGFMMYDGQGFAYFVRCVRNAGCQDYGGKLGWMCEVPAGDFMMGCNGDVDTECDGIEFPYHKVTVPPFEIDKYLVTAAQYKACVDDGACSAPDVGGRCTYWLEYRQQNPVNCVDWDQAGAYCAWAGKRLPTEAEWEKAARGTDGRKYPWGNSPGPSCDFAVMADPKAGGQGCGSLGTLPVGSRPKGEGPFGTLDTIGNLWEWLEDDVHLSYNGAPTDGSAWVDTPRGQMRILRGGGFYTDNPASLRVSTRGGNEPDDKYLGYGFRCAR
jgi:formylglycine-generating enzyme required for sulfatase activity